MVEKIGLGDKEWTIDSRDLNFTDATLNAFFEKVGAIIDYVGAGHALAMKLHSIAELEYKKKYIDKFKDLKDQGKSDKTAELSAEGDPESIDLKRQIIAQLPLYSLVTQNNGGKIKFTFFNEQVWQNCYIEFNLNNFTTPTQPLMFNVYYIPKIKN